MEFKRLRAAALLFLAIGGIALASTRYKTDEVVSEDGGPVAFPGGITVPTEAHYPASTAAFFSSASYSAAILGHGGNVDSVTSPATLRYNRVGNQVHVWGRVGVDPSGAGTTDFNVALPIRPDYFTATSQAWGTAGIPTTATNGTCHAVSTSVVVRCTFTASSGSAALLNVNFNYRVQ